LINPERFTYPAHICYDLYKSVYDLYKFLVLLTNDTLILIAFEHIRKYRVEKKIYDRLSSMITL